MLDEQEEQQEREIPERLERDGQDSGGTDSQQLTDEQVQGYIQDAADASAQNVAADVTQSMDALTAAVAESDSGASEVTGTVSISTQQYEEMRGLFATELQGVVVLVGLLSLLLGVAVSLVVTLHWRSR